MLRLDILVNIANVIYLASYSVRDILLLRILTVIGILLLIPYYYFQSHVLWTPIFWNVVFMTINSIWIAKLLLERRPVQFSEEEKRLYEVAFRNMKPREALELFQRGAWTSEPAGTQLLTQAQEVSLLRVIVNGRASVEANGDRVDTLSEGRFVGSSAFLNRDADFRSPVTVRAIDQIRVLTWSFDELESLFARNVDFEVKLEASLGLELTKFLQTAIKEIPHA